MRTNRWGTFRYGVCLLAMVLVVGGCASAPSYDGSFSEKERIHGSSETLPASMETTWGAALEVFAQQGFLIQQANKESRTILANRHVRDKNDEDTSYMLSTTLTLVPVSDQATRAILAANQSTELYKKQYRWWKLLWMIPLFPVGSDHTTTVTNRDTIRSPQFYHDFFAAMKKSVEEKNGLQPTAAPPAAAPTIPPTIPPAVTQ